jgi:hypothetical protein
MFFSPEDSDKLNSLGYVSDISPRFEMIKSILVWEDEIPKRISEDGMDKLYDLLIARSYVHDNQLFSSHFSGGKHLEKAWTESRNEIPNWPGFKRLLLSKKDRHFYDDERRKVRDDEY